MPITLTLDLEDSTGLNARNGRWVAATDRFLDALSELGVRATVFVVGVAAQGCPAIVRRVADAGHEIGLHGLHHVPLGDLDAQQLASDLTEGRAILEDIVQRPVTGFRAPIFSLTPSTAWAVAALTDAGFTYDSSILPARNPLHGWPGLPEQPFVWDSGLVELPCPVLGVGPARVPYLGGIYLRYVPLAAAKRALASMPASALPWSYIHPYDVDRGAPIRRFPHANWPTSLLLHTRRGATLRRLRAVVDAAGGPAAPLGELVAALDHSVMPLVEAR